jgi:hypothetical protein
MNCSWVRFAYRALPLAPWRAFLLDRHIDRCPHCQGQALAADALRALGKAAADLAGEPPLRPFAVAGGPFRARAAARRYAFALFLAVAVLGATAWLWRLMPRHRLPEGTVTILEESGDDRAFAVLEARIGEEPARPVVFQPGKGGMTIVWFERATH